MCRREDSYFKQVDKNYYINKRLMYLGIETKYTAFYFLSDILRKMINEGVRVHSFSRQIYPLLAQKYNKNDCSIERNIRNLIEQRWSIISLKLTDYWQKTCPPTCCQFIKIIRDYIADLIA